MSAPSSHTTTHSFHWNYSELDDSNFQIHGSTLYFILVIFAIIFFASTLFFYSKWIFTLFRPRGQHAAHHVGLDPAEIRKLPVVSYNKVSSDLSSEQAECSICLGILEQKDQVKVMPMCGHCFHSLCVDNWLTRHSTCPLCRSSVRVDSPV